MSHCGSLKKIKARCKIDNSRRVGVTLKLDARGGDEASEMSQAITIPIVRMRKVKIRWNTAFLVI